eukprot:13088165-Heterocapsa_arctica.AAC.1
MARRQINGALICNSTQMMVTSRRTWSSRRSRQRTTFWCRRSARCLPRPWGGCGRRRRPRRSTRSTGGSRLSNQAGDDRRVDGLHEAQRQCACVTGERWATLK